MKLRSTYLFTCLLFINSLFAEDIYLKNGDVYKNVKILIEKDKTILIKYRGEESTSTEYTLYKDEIEKIDRTKEYDSKITSKFVPSQSNTGQINPHSHASDLKMDVNNDPCNDKQYLKLKAKDSLTIDEMKAYIEFTKLCENSKNRIPIPSTGQQMIKTQTYPNLGFLVLGIVAFGGTYYFLKESSDNSDAADLATKLHLNGNEFQSKATTNLLAGIGCGLVGLISTVYAVTPVEVKTDLNSASVSFRYYLK